MRPDPAPSVLEPALPPPLREEAERLWRDYGEAAAAAGVAPPQVPAQVEELLRVWAGSEFIARHCIREPALLAEQLDTGDLTRVYAVDEMAARLAAALEPVGDEAALAVALRRFRRREMVRIAWRDLTGRAALDEVTSDLSALAEACIDQALERLYGWHVEQWGTPYDAKGDAQRLVVLGMGKLGARELNFSSDIDLIFAYAEGGETSGGRRSTSHQEFFVRLGQRLVQALGNVTADGFVFRVDMRLRPFGESSALALSFDALEDYYQVHGREWERYAMIKARVVAGDRAAGARLMAMLRPFVYRRYVDFGAFESLREMKAMIEREVRRKGMEGNVKLGAGGIREVEFIGQAFQLIRGGREPALQAPPLLPALETVRGFGWLPDYVVDELTAAYTFLRNTEHRLQEFADQQTHRLPEEPLGRARLAFAMGFADWEGFAAALERRREQVHSHFEQVFAAPQGEHAAGDELDLTGVWQGAQEEARALGTLSAAGFAEPAAALTALVRLRQSRAARALGAEGRGRLDRLMPLLIGAAGQAGHPDAALARSLELVEAIGRRSAYLALLFENPMALSQLVRLCDASPWIAHQLARYPLLLDELLDPRTLYMPPPAETLVGELRQRLSAVDAEDLERQMETLRQFKLTNVLRVAAADVVGAVPLMVVSDHLTAIAEAVLAEVLGLAWRYLTARHGRPHCGDDLLCDTGFAVIGYGKLGGLELGYGSDLDIVFLHSDDSRGRATDGDRPVDNAVFYARLAQRIIHLLGTRTAAGVLYEVDTRLRPSGASGLLVSSLKAFDHYQGHDAWTWEHQALVRARVVAGDARIAERFEALRREVLGRERDLGTLRREVQEMRERMRAHLDHGEAGRFDLKQGAGGIADIEFMVQYGVLAWSHAHPGLLDYTDNIRLLERLADAGLMAPADADALADAYRAYRAEVHRLTLQEQPAVTEEAPLRGHREAVTALWQRLMET